MTPLRLVGAAVIFLCAMATVREYSAFCHRRIAQSAAFLRFVRHIGDRVCVYLVPIGTAAREFDDGELSGVGFLDAVRSGGSLRSAFELSLGKLLISEQERELLSSFFKEFGSAYIDDERVRVEKMNAALLRIHTDEEKKTKESEKVVRTLVLALALGIIILIL